MKRCKVPAMVTAISKILNIRNQELNAIAKVNGLRLRLKGVPKRTLNILNATYDSVGYKTTTTLLDRYAEKVPDLAAAWNDAYVTHVGDNVDVRSVRRYESSEGSVNDLHLYNNILLRSRLNLDGLSDQPPATRKSFTTQELQNIIPTSEDVTNLITDLTPIVAEHWAKFSDKFQSLSTRKDHQYCDSMTTKTEMVCIMIIVVCALKKHTITAAVFTIMLILHDLQGVCSIGDLFVCFRVKFFMA